MFSGFDMIPRLSKSKAAVNRWQSFLLEVEQTYGGDDSLVKSEHGLQFMNTKTLSLPHSPDHFLRFSAPTSKSRKEKNLIKYIHKIATKYFAKNVIYFDEELNQLGHYSWEEVLTKDDDDHEVVVFTRSKNGKNSGELKFGFELNSKFCIQLLQRGSKIGSMSRSGVDELVTKLEDLGRRPGLDRTVIKMAYIPGEVVYNQCTAISKVLMKNVDVKRCTTCFERSKKLKPCRCNQTQYCSTSCKEMDWKVAHDLECSLALDVNSPDFDNIRKILRLFIILKKDPSKASQVFTTHNQQRKCFNDLPLNLELGAETEHFKELCQKLAQQLQEIHEIQVDVDYLLKLYGSWRLNEVMYYDEGCTSPIGTGLFLEPGFMEHSCRPNCVMVQRGVGGQIRTIAYVPLGQKLTMSKIPGNYHSRSKRQSILLDRFNIKCSCELCKAEEKGDLINYSALEQLVHQAEEIPRLDLKQVVNLRKKALELYRKVFYEFDERSVGFCLANWHMIIESKSGDGDNPIDIGEYSRDTETRARVTLGVGFGEYLGLIKLKK